MWFLTQHRRWGLLKDDPDYLAVAQKVNRIEIFKEAAAAKTPLPKEPMRESTLIDGGLVERARSESVRRVVQAQSRHRQGLRTPR
jgi:hypothetical protein